MNSSFQLEVKLMYREFMKIIYRMPANKRTTLLNKTKEDFKHASKLSRRDISGIDFAFHRAQRQLDQLRSSNIESMSFYTPKGNNN